MSFKMLAILLRLQRDAMMPKRKLFSKDDKKNHE